MSEVPGVAAPTEPTPAAPAPTGAVPVPGEGSPSPAPDGGAAAAVPLSTPPEPAAAPAEPILVEPTNAADEAIAAAHAPGLLSVAEPAKAEPAAPAAPAEPAAPAPADAVAPDAPLSYADHPLTLPDDVQFDDARLGEYDAILGSHRLPPEVRQQLADLYAGDVQEMMKRVRRDQHDAWTTTRADWREDCAADPDFGGAAFETHRAAAVRMIEFVVPPDERADFNLFLAATGAADHPQFFRFLNRLAQRFGAPAAAPPNIRPAPPQTQARPRRVRDFYNSNRGA